MTKKIDDEIIKKRFEEKYPNFEYIGGYKNCQDKMIIKCRICNCEFEYTSANLRPSRNANIQCKSCNENEKKKKKQLLLELKRKEKENKKLQKNIEKENKKLQKMIEKEKAEKLKEVVHICQECGKSFATKKLNKKYCSQSCCNRHNNSTKNMRRRSKAIDNGECDYSITLTKLIVRDKGICKICGGKVDTEHFFYTKERYFIALDNYPSIDHIKPLNKQGTHTWDNVQLAHRRCNSCKSDKDMYEENKGQLKMSI